MTNQNDDMFLRAFAFTVANEGGYVFDPADLGGATNHGITIATLSQYLGRKASIDEVKALTYSSVEPIYKKLYWLPLGCDKLASYVVAAALFDTGVLFGIGVAIRYAQISLNLCGVKVKVDGLTGRQTTFALNSVNAADFIKVYHQQFLNRISHIVAARPENTKFKAGWTNRVNKLFLLA